MPLLSIRAALFDFDGTLVDSLPGIHAAFSAAFVAKGHAAPALAAVRRTIGLTLERSIAELLPTLEAAQTTELVTLYRTLHDSHAAPHTRLFEGARQAVEAVRSAGIQTLLVSNKGHAGLHQLVGQLDLGGLFDHILSATGVAFCKPDPRLYTTHIAPLLAGLSSAEVIMIGDTEADLAFARDAGLRSCWAAYGYGNSAACRTLAPTATMQSIAELPAILERPLQRPGTAAS